VNGDPSDLQATINAARTQQDVLAAHPVHAPWSADRLLLQRGLDDLIQGYGYILARHPRATPGLTSKQLATRGIDQITSAQTDLKVKVASCAP
jgi:hypothetical protein